MLTDRIRALYLMMWGWVKAALVYIVRSGPIPKHVAFIMDGNRRFATKQGLQSISGHQQGYQKLLDALQWCLDLGVEAITVYAFSIDNFRRDRQEVDALMALAEEKLLDLLDHQDIIDTNEVQVRVIGDLSLLPAPVQRAANQVMQATRHHQRCRLNICMAYTSRQEMAHAVHAVEQQVAEGSLALQDVKTDTLERLLYTQGCPPVNLLIRTSGEHRLSDFMLWQSRYAQLVFSDTLWPDYSFWDLLQALVQYQRSYPELQKLKRLANIAPSQTARHPFQNTTDSLSLMGRCSGASQEQPTCMQENHAEIKCVGGHLMGVISDTDMSDSSASSESRQDSPVASPKHTQTSNSQSGMTNGAQLQPQLQAQQTQHIQTGDKQQTNAPMCTGCQAEACIGQKPPAGSPNLDVDEQHAGDGSAVSMVQHRQSEHCPSELHQAKLGSKVPSRTLHAQADCRQAGLQSLKYRSINKANTDT